MSKRRAGRGSKYTDDFKRRLVAESQGDGARQSLEKVGIPLAGDM